MVLFDVKKIREDFPILNQEINGKPLIYFDNAATTQKPQVMIDSLVEYYSSYNANIHRGIHTLSQKATEAYESTRRKTAELFNCDFEEVIFTKSDTESLNLLAYSLGELVLDGDSNIVISESEHHSNIVPWQLVQRRNRKYETIKKVSGVLPPIDLRYVSFNADGLHTFEEIKDKIDKNTKILSFTWASNTFGVVNDAKEIILKAKELSPEIIVIVDAAQIVPHQKVDFKDLTADFITFSAHKMCGPTGVGVLIGKKEILQKMPPFLGGGDMIREVGIEETTFADLPYKFEAGTPNIADVIAFKSSLHYLELLGFEQIQGYCEELTYHLLRKLQELDFIELYGPKLHTSDFNLHPNSKLPLVSFNVKGVHAHDVGTLLDEDGIAVRTGHHCTQLIMKKLNIPASVRASLYFYNTKEEIDVMVDSLKRIRDIFQ